MNKRYFDIVIVGGGPAGLAAAAAASHSGLRVAVVDENPDVGGQIWRAEKSRISPAAADLIARVGDVEFLSVATVFDAADSTLICDQIGQRIEISYKKLIVATGARELFLPFPGWTLPGVYGAGGLQALVKGGFEIANKRVVVAGSGPLLLAVADYLKSKGAKVVAIVEQARSGSIRKFARSLWHSPDKLTQAAAMRARLLGVPYKTDSFITSVSDENGEILVRVGPREYHCDLVACGFHLVPNLELPSLLCCDITNGVVTVDELQRTSVDNIFCAGESTGIGGVDKSLIEGEIAGLAAIDRDTDARRLSSKRSATHAFADRLNNTFRLRDELKRLANDDTLFCRCEDVTLGAVKTFDGWREAKLQTRCGMGPCQGRICGAAARFIFDWDVGTARPPLYPVKLENL